MAATQFRRSPRYDLDAVVAKVPVVDPDTHEVIGHRDVTRLERIVEAVRIGASFRDAAVRGGIDEATLRSWRRQGAQAIQDYWAGRLVEPRGSIEQKMRLVWALEEADADRKTNLLAVAGRIANGGVKKRDVIEESDANGVLVKRTIRETTTLPEGNMVRWLLASRYPTEFGRQRIEHVGADGGPIEVDTLPAKERLRAALARTRENLDATSPEALADMTAGNGSGNGADENGPR